MISEPKRIMVALVAHGDEKPVIEQAVLLANKFEAQLIAFHVHQPVLSQPKGDSELNVTEEIIRNRFTEYGFEGSLHRSVKDALKAAKQSASHNDLIYVGGSTFVVAEII